MGKHNPLQEAGCAEDFKRIWRKYVEPWKEKRRECEYMGDSVVIDRPAMRPVCELTVEGCSFLKCPRKEEFSEAVSDV